MPRKNTFDTSKVISVLNRILELELAGVVRYTHYSLMVFGHNRLPLVQWMRTQASEGLLHAVQAGEFITSLGGHPSLTIGKLLETERHEISQILEETLEHERDSVVLYYDLLKLVKDKSISLEEYARTMVRSEEEHISEVEKMIRAPGSLD